MIRRVPLDEDEENPDRWLVSYADFITLLFAFFVVMYAISSVNLSKYNALTNSMGTAFTGEKAQNNPSQEIRIQKHEEKTIVKPLPLSYLYQQKSARERENMAKMGLEIANKLVEMIQNNQVQVIQNNRGVRIDINDSLLFTSGSAELAPSAVALINQIASSLSSHQRLLQIEGHTDNTPIHNASFYSNWELSAVRASTVVRLLSAAGIAETRLSAVGFAATQPISSSDTDFGRAKNRRVSIMVLYETKLDSAEPVEIKPQL